jgi:type II secretory pathway pseudopilin PulG
MPGELVVSYPTRSRKSFTLLELMVAFIIMAVLSAVAIPSLIGVVGNDQVTADSTSAVSIVDAAYYNAESQVGEAHPTLTFPITALEAAQFIPAGSTLSAGDLTPFLFIDAPVQSILFSFGDGNTIYVSAPQSDGAPSPAVLGVNDGGTTGSTTSTSTSTTTTTVAPTTTTTAVPDPRAATCSVTLENYTPATGDGAANTTGYNITCTNEPAYLQYFIFSLNIGGYEFIGNVVSPTSYSSSWSETFTGGTGGTCTTSSGTGGTPVCTEIYTFNDGDNYWTFNDNSNGAYIAPTVVANEGDIVISIDRSANTVWANNNITITNPPA